MKTFCKIVVWLVLIYIVGLLALSVIPTLCS